MISFKLHRVFFPLALLCLCTIAHAEEWPVKKFEVFLGPPVGSNLALGDPVGGIGFSLEQLLDLVDNWVDIDTPSDPPSSVDLGGIADIETYLEEIAHTLESQGFKSPVLGPVVRGRNGEPVFRVYYYSYSSALSTNAPAFYRNSQCGTVRPLMAVNADKMLAGRPTLTPKNYQDLAHELFHAIQPEYLFFKEDCAGTLGKWLYEGTAQAMGADLAAWSSRAADFDSPEGDWVFHRWGIRAYDRALTARVVTPSAEYEAQYPGREQAANVDYGSSSFWRYLGETIASKGAAGTKVIKPDYSYLQTLFNSSFGGAPGWSGEADWLAEQIAASPKFKLPLDRLFPQFTTTYAAYMHTRFSSRIPRADATNAFLDKSFPDTGCPLLKLNDGNPVSRIPVKIEPLAAACLRVELAFSYPTDIEISISGGSELNLQALFVGTQAGRVVSKPLPISFGERWEASSIFHIPTSLEPAVFIISNIGDVPGATEPVDLMVRVAPTWNEHNLAPQGPTRPTPVPQQPASSRPEGGGELITAESQREHVGNQIQEGWDTLNPNTAHGNTVKRLPENRPCADPFVFQACGPNTTISLSMVPGMFGSLTQSTGRGGIFGQFASMLSGVAANDPANHQVKLREMVEFSESIDGAEVVMAFPLIDYGYTGTFNNASLKVSARNRKTYRAIGPADIQPGPGRMFPLSGRVTIDEYTPNVLRGSYSGNLVDTDRVVELGEDESLPTHETIRGRFQIIANWRGDNRFVVQGPDDPAKEVGLDVMQMIPGLDLEAIEAMIGGQGSGQDPNTGSTGGGRVDTGRSGFCDCSCNRQEEASGQCQTVCAETYKACAGLTALAMPVSSLLEKAVQKNEGGLPFLRSMPSACNLVSKSTASVFLAAQNVELIGPREYIPKVTSQCAYRDTNAKRRKIQVKMLFASLLLYDSRNEPLNKLRVKVDGFGSHEHRAQLIDGVGYKTFGMNGGDTTSLVALTGIYGTGMKSDDFVTELVVTYKLTDATKTPPERMMALIGLVRPQLAELQNLAVTTHVGAK